MRHLHLACVSFAIVAPACGTRSLYLGERLSADAADVATESGAGGASGFPTGTSNGGAGRTGEAAGGTEITVGIGTGGARIADGGTSADAWASASAPKVAAVNGGALESIANWLLASPKPVVTSLAVVPRDSGAMVVLAEGHDGSRKRLSVRRARPGSSGPDLSEVWAMYDSAFQQAWGRLSAAALGDGIAVYYQQGPSIPGTSVRQGLLRFDAAGSLVQGPDDSALPSAGTDAPNCTLAAGNDRVLLVCVSGSNMTLRACPAVGSCTDPIRISANAGSKEPPSIVVTDEDIQLFHEEYPSRLRRVVVDKSTLAVRESVDLLKFAASGLRDPGQGTAPAAVRIDAGVFVAFGFPRQFGIWDTQSTQLRLSAPDATKDDWGAYWVTGRSYPAIAILKDSVYLLESTSLGQLDQSFTQTQLVRVNPETLDHDVVAKVDTHSALYSDAQSSGVITMGAAGLALLSVANGVAPSYNTQLLSGVYDVSPLGIACDANHCQSLMSQPWTRSDGISGREWGIWSVDRDTDRVTPPAASVRRAGDDSGTFLSATPDQTAIAFGSELEIFKDALATPVSLEASPLKVIAAFPEAEGLRVFSYTDDAKVIEHRLLAKGSMTAPVATDPVFMGNLYGCDGSYFTLMADDERDYSIWRMRPAVSPHAERIGGFSGEGFYWDNVHCSGDAMFLLHDVFEEGAQYPDYFVVVRRLDGTPVAQVALPKQAEPVSSQALGGSLYLLWKPPTQTDVLGLTLIDSSGRAAQFDLPLPKGKNRKQTGLLEVAIQNEVRLVWTADDGSPFASIWRLPIE